MVNILSYIYLCAFIYFVNSSSDNSWIHADLIQARQNIPGRKSVETFMKDLQGYSSAVNGLISNPDTFMFFSKQFLERIKKYKEALDMKNKIAEQVKLILQSTWDQEEYAETYNALLQNSKDVFIKECSYMTLRQTSVQHICDEKNHCIQVLCNMDIDGGNWTVIQQRLDGAVPFDRTWQEYKDGFGKLDDEFWLGNNKIHALTSLHQYELRIDISDLEGNSWYAVYDKFRVEDEASKYKLLIGSYTGTAGDALSYHNNMAFSTHNSDNDQWSSSCSKRYGDGGWWFNCCTHSSLNGKYGKGLGDQGIDWVKAKGKSYSMKFSRMMIRKRN